MNANAPQLSLIIPAYNESAIILRNVQEVQKWMGRNKPDVSYEIVVVDDGSTDGMGALLDKASKTDPTLRVLHHPVNYGRGRAIRTGMENTASDYAVMLDADLSYAPDHIDALVAPLQSGEADLTLASPYHPDGEVKNVPAFRAWLSKWGNYVLSHAFQRRYYTSTCVVRGYTRKLIDHLELVSTEKDLHLEVLYKTELLGFAIKEVPAKLVWRDKKRGRTATSPLNRLVNNSLFKMRKAILSHLFFNFLTKPKLLFLGPILVLLGLFLYGLITLFYVFFGNWAQTGFAAPAERILRQTLIDGSLTLNLTVNSFILLLGVSIFLFLASQAKRYFEENYILTARANYRMKQVERALNKRD